MVQASLKKQLRNLSQYTWMSWDDAANYLLTEKIDLEDALTYANKSIENEDRYENELRKSMVLTALNRKEEAATARKKALDLASPPADPLLRPSTAVRETQRRGLRDLPRQREKTSRSVVRAYGAGSNVLRTEQV